MLEMKMTSLLPHGGVDGGLELLNELKWNISIIKREGAWLVFGGDKCLLKSSTEEAAHAFVYGLALAYGVLPAAILDQVRKASGEASGE